MAYRYLSFVVCSLYALVGLHGEATESQHPWWVKADFLYMKAREGRLQFATEPQPSQGIIDTTDFTFVKPDYEWKGGWRLELGRQWENWAGFLTWAEMSGEAHGKVKVPFEAGFFPVWELNPNIFLQDQVQQGKLHWDADIDLIDLGAKVNLFFSKKYFRLQSKMALRGGWIDQNIHADYSQGLFVGGMAGRFLFAISMEKSPDLSISSLPKREVQS